MLFVHLTSILVFIDDMPSGNARYPIIIWMFVIKVINRLEGCTINNALCKYTSLLTDGVGVLLQKNQKI